MLETLQIINTIIIIAAGAFGLLVTFSKPLRIKLFNNKKAREAELKEILERLESIEEELQERRDTDKGFLRRDIVEIYYKRRSDGEIRQYEFENISKLYSQYKKLGGNSFIDKLWDEISDWTIIS